MELDLRKEESQLSKAACFGLELTSLNVFHFVTFNFCLSEFLFFCTVSTLYFKKILFIMSYYCAVLYVWRILHYLTAVLSSEQAVQKPLLPMNAN